MPDRAGQQLGNYRLLRLLGRGGFAEVYLGEHVYLKRRAALKVLHIALEEEDVEHFLAEARVLALLDHPNIVRVHEFAVEQGTPFLVMDYAPRGTLRQRHPRGSCLSLQTTAAYVKQIASALQYAHNHQVIHRDVKPENMLLGAQQELLLSDFGISLLSPSPERLSTQEMAGTLPYMAPEQIRGKPGFASDQCSLAVIVYEWLCGVRPFAGATWQIVYQQVSLAPAPLREHDPSLPETVEAVVLKALAKDPRERYVSVQLFAQALERASQVSRLGLDADTEVTTPLRAISPVGFSTPPAISQRIFLSAAPEDEAFAARITPDLQQRGIAVWNADPEITQNVLEQENVVRQAIRAVDVVLLVVSPATPSSRSVREHLRIASLYQRQLVFVWAAGEEIAAVLPDAWGRAAQIDLLDARNGRYERALGEIVAWFEDPPGEERSFAESAEELRDPRNPYKGLRPFTQHDAADFFGRDSLIAELMERLREAEQPGMPQARLLAVIGPSGSGKSSVMMAGLLPRLQGGTLAGSERWVYLEPMVPGTHPVEALLLTLASRFPERSLKNLREDLEDASARGLHLLAKQLSTTAEQKVVLFIDQFEELFTLTASEEERQQFIDLLTPAVTEPQGVVIVLLTLRADFYDRPMAYPTLHRLLETHQKSVLPMEVADLRAVIKRPAALPDVQLSFEGNLVGDLLFEVHGQAGALPLLQFTLEQLFQRRDGHMLTLAAYHEIGGVKGALAKHAESTYVALPSEEHRKLACALFLRLIDPGVSEQDTTRRRAALAELRLPDTHQATIMGAVADAFVAARLLTTNEGAGIITLEVSHEALIREWARLADWLREARDDIRLQHILSEDAAEWQRRKQPADRLYRGSQLKEAQVWVRRNTPSGNEVAFLRASAARRVRSVVSVFAVLLLVAASLGTASWFLTHQAPDPTRITNLQDRGPGSLRQAIDISPPGSTITFAQGLKGTIKLTSGDISINKKITIQGPGAGIIAIISSNGYGIRVNSGFSASIASLAFTGGTFSSNGIISNSGTLKMVNSTISGDMVTDGVGGGILNDGILTLINSTVSGNRANRCCGGIYNKEGALTLINSTFSDNTTEGDGGGIESNGMLTLVNSTVSDNSANGRGGGIVNYSTLILSASTVSGNASLLPDGACAPDVNLPPYCGGGGIYSYGSALTLLNSTIYGNAAIGGYGGGIAILNEQASITFCTINDNTAARGGGIFVAAETSASPGNVEMRNSIVAGNHVNSGRGPDILGMLTSDGYNLIQNLSGIAFLDPHKMHHTDLSGSRFPNLGVDGMLRNNGGSTQTLALLSGSPLIDQIPLNTCLIDSKPATDQRGVKRPDGNEHYCDTGAYESSY